ncbi:MAG: hypothetical protein HCA25_14060 [Dolichospermum sp. DET50]|nr:hypothetical protein [Dolichospermum sp. DET66]MBS3033363.1 hypothetical protein [Dolichospermum sp. DET67]MBS3038567.1 hypothetical protein [Dolichospermum sp. DET50]QSX70656.1 MAG: hypothetical protein EZY12_13310 [Dolichospermum sp. DET69]
MLKEVFGRLTEKGIVLEVTDRFKDRLITEGYSPELYKNMQICSDSQGLYYLVAGSDLNESDADNLLKDAESKFLKGNYKTGTNSVPYNSNSCNKEF